MEIELEEGSKADPGIMVERVTIPSIAVRDYYVQTFGIECRCY
jgi:hypothetical protein